MSKNLPAYRYELFVKLFEQHVTAVQKQIEHLRRMEQPYTLVKEAMESQRLPNEQTIAVGPYGVYAKVVAAPTDSLSAFDAAAKAIGNRLLAADLHGDGEPCVRMGGDFCDVDYIWQCRNSRTVCLTIKMPAKGLSDLEVVETERVTQTHEYVMRRKEPPAYAAPAFPVAAGPEAGLVAALDPEVPF